MERHESFAAEMQKHKEAMGYGPKQRFLHVGGAAKEVGLDKVYTKYYPMFSKAAHQTAMLLMVGPERHPMGAGLPELFANIAIWEIVKAVVSGFQIQSSRCRMVCRFFLTPARTQRV